MCYVLVNIALETNGTVLAYLHLATGQLATLAERAAAGSASLAAQYDNVSMQCVVYCHMTGHDSMT